MNTENQDKNIALAAMCQAAHYVQEIAQGKTVPDEDIEYMLSSILETQPENIEAIYSSPARHLRLGFEHILSQLQGQGTQTNPNIARYVINIMSLERKLIKRPDLLGVLSERIEQIKRQREHFELTNPQMLENIASIYSDLISPVGPQIRVMGTPEDLQKPLVQHQIRALLLAGIRACFLWRQLGGRRLHLLFSRGSIATSVKKILHNQ